MDTLDASHYAEILILVDGWPWNLSEFDFRRFFAPGSCPQALLPVAALAKPAPLATPSRVSENRRAPRRRGKKERRRRRAQAQAQARAAQAKRVA